MKCLIDNSVLSEALRHKNPSKVIRTVFAELLREDKVLIIGAIRQEFLSGIPHPAQYLKLQKLISELPITDTLIEDYDTAAYFYNICRHKGIQGSPTDLLLCAVASRLKLPILTTDQDFKNYAALLPISLYPS
jgi:predicted nucleic acid-binding protein